MTQKAKYTPGPWGHNGEGIIHENSGNGIAKVYMHPVYRVTDKKMQANTRLIAAAPDMYEALKAVYSELAHWSTESFNLLKGEQIENALNKAEGK